MSRMTGAEKKFIIKSRKSNNNSFVGQNKIPLYLHSVNNSRKGTAALKAQHLRTKTVTPKVHHVGSSNNWATSSQIWNGTDVYYNTLFI